jgi:arylformamidase
MTLIDITWPLNPQTTAYKDKKTIHFTATKNFAEHGVRESLITLNSHSGTHVDAPAHFLKDGNTSEKISLSALCGPCIVIDMTHCNECITQEDLKDIRLEKNVRVLFKTKNSFLSPTAPFNPAFIYLEKSAAQFLVQQNSAAVGIDYLGIERNQPAHETHIALLENNIPIIEGLRLAQVQPRKYLLICAPLAIEGLDGAPARAFLIDQSQSGQSEILGSSQSEQ